MADPKIPEMVLRVARAITPDYNRISRNSRQNALITARVAIKVMREPTEAMLKAGKPYQSESAVNCAWRAMIDAALEDSK